MIVIGGFIAALVAFIYYIYVSSANVVSNVVEVDVVDAETGEVEQAAAKVEPAVVVTDIKLNSKNAMTLAEVQLIDMSDKPINIKDASVTSSEIHKKYPWPATRLVDGNTTAFMHSARAKAFAHIKLATPITLGELKKIIVWNRSDKNNYGVANGTTIKLYNGETLLHEWTLEGAHKSYSFDF